MRNSWTVTHDPLRLTVVGADFAPREMDARLQGEDILQAERLPSKGTKKILDLGWYEDHYLVLLVEDAEWESPLERIECRDLASAMEAFHRISI